VADLSDEARAELAEAVRILRDDGVHLHKTYRKKFLADPPGDPQPEPGDGDPPPPKDPTADPPSKPRKRGVGLWGATE